MPSVFDANLHPLRRRTGFNHPSTGGLRGPQDLPHRGGGALRGLDEDSADPGREEIEIDLKGQSVRL